jgi:hypothetical protein
MGVFYIACQPDRDVEDVVIEHIYGSEYFDNTIIHMNDQQFKSFSEIADWIDNNIEKVADK